MGLMSYKESDSTDSDSYDLNLRISELILFYKFLMKYPTLNPSIDQYIHDCERIDSLKFIIPSELYNHATAILNNVAQEHGFFFER
jgi:hypothetical protein